MPMKLLSEELFSRTGGFERRPDFAKQVSMASWRRKNMEKGSMSFILRVRNDRVLNAKANTDQLQQNLHSSTDSHESDVDQDRGHSFCDS